MGHPKPRPSNIVKIRLEKVDLGEVYIQKEQEKGPFNNYVNRILTIFDHLPTPSEQTY